jgi:hypothetical protein
MLSALTMGASASLIRLERTESVLKWQALLFSAFKQGRCPQYCQAEKETHSVDCWCFSWSKLNSLKRM